MPSQAQDPNAPPPNIDFTSPYTPRRPAPILSISMNHPIGKAARKIKNFLVHKQTLFSTTFTIKITPIVSIVSLFGLVTLFGGGWTTAYHFGKTVEEKFLAESQGGAKNLSKTDVIVNVSKAGIVKTTYNYISKLSYNSVTPAQIIPTQNLNLNASGSALQPTLLPTPTPSPIPSSTPIIAHYILARGESIIFLTGPSSIHLKEYVGLKVLVTGNLDQSKNTLTIEKPEDIEILQ